MAALFRFYNRLAAELKVMIWDSAIPSPGVHFLKPNGSYNGTCWSPAGENCDFVQGPGVSEVSSMSAGCERARLSMVSYLPRGRLIAISTWVAARRLLLKADC